MAGHRPANLDLKGSTVGTSIENALQWPVRGAARYAAIAMSGVLLALLSATIDAQAGDIERVPGEARRGDSFDMAGVSVWFRQRFSDAELENYRPEDFHIESHACGCYDEPEPHYPYLLVFFNTPKGDLVGRPDRRGLDTVITRLAVRHGERYCDVDSEDQCYGNFAHPCEFSDFQYGPALAKYFPTCKSLQPDAELTPVDYRIN